MKRVNMVHYTREEGRVERKKVK